MNTITQSIKDDGWSFFESVLQDLGLAGTPVEDAARGLYDDAFSAIQWLLDAPLAVLKDLAEFIHNELMPRAINGQATPQVLSQAIASHISAQSASDLSIPLKFNLLTTSVDLGTWTLPAPQVLGSMSNGVLGDATVNGHLQSLTGNGNGIGSMLSQQNAATALRDQELSQQQAAQQFGALASGITPTARIEAPGDNTVATGFCTAADSADWRERQLCARGPAERRPA